MSHLDSPPPIESFAEENRELVAVLRGDDDAARLEELRSIGETDDEVADELLRILGSDAAEEIRSAAAIALGPSLELCDWELDEEGRLSAAQSDLSLAPFSQSTYDRVLAELRRVLDDPAAPRLVRRRALEAAVRSPQEWQVESIRAAWRGGDPDWRVTALFCMGYCYPADFSAEIEEGFRSDSEELRREAILAAGRCGLENLLPEVTAIAGDSESPRELRLAAVEALGSLGGDDAVELLEELCADEDEELCDLAEEALEELQMTRGLVDLDDEADDESDWL